MKLLLDECVPRKFKLVTVDRGIEFEQNLTRRNIAVILVCAKSSRLADLLPHVPEILKLLPSIKRRQLVRVGS